MVALIANGQNIKGPLVHDIGIIPAAFQTIVMPRLLI